MIQSVDCYEHCDGHNCCCDSWLHYFKFRFFQSKFSKLKHDFDCDADLLYEHGYDFLGCARFGAALLEKQSVLRKGSCHSILNFFDADCCGFEMNFHKSLFLELKRKVIAGSP